MTSSETTFNDAELIARLRDFDKVTVGDARVAADRIEALEAALAKAKAPPPPASRIRAVLTPKGGGDE